MSSVAVRTLCEFSARSGDLDYRFTPSPTAMEGIQGHARVRSRRSSDYQAEYPLAGECGGLSLKGRADGYDPVAGYIEEIKTHRGDLQRLPQAQQAMHWAQLRAYAALLCAAESRQEIELRLTYFDIVSNRETVLKEQATAASLWQTLATLCRDYADWAGREQVHRVRRDRALETLKFPFDRFRSGQRSLAEQTYRSLFQGQVLMLQAPTGIGKTMGTLFPALMAMAKKGLHRLFYLTSRNTARQLAVDAIERLFAERPDGLPLRVLVLLSREQACEHPDLACHGDSCPLAQGFFDRLPAARSEAANLDRVLDRERLRDLALAHQICPYYLAQEMARWSDLVIADVNRFFDLHAGLHALTMQNGWRVALLVDEAHSLVSRARGMYSAELSQQRLLALKRTAHPSLKKPLQRLARGWSELLAAEHLNRKRREGDSGERILPGLPGRLLATAQSTAAAINDHLDRHEADAELQQLLFEILRFNRLAERFADHSQCSLSRSRRGRARLEIRNLIPADLLAPRFLEVDSAVLFSATLTPQYYFRDLLGLPQSSAWLEVESPFATEQLDVQIASHVSTRMQHRDASIDPIVTLIRSRYHRHPGNYLAYFSSFDYLESVYKALRDADRHIPLWRQERGMSEGDRQAFIDRFTENGSGIGFAVLGGAFGEGIDLPGRRLIGVFIATLGLPPFDARQRQLQDRLQKRYGKGYDYTYLYPGMQKVLQAAGRLIRSPQDRGLLVLIDDRFTWPKIQRLLPAWWAAGPPD